MLDTVIRNGLLIDGTGASGRHADVGIDAGRIVAIGVVDERAAREIDAAGRVVAPGFVDVHTHFDAQAFWDPTLSPAPQHGVTTVVAGNCGFSIAPLSSRSSDYLIRMLARVEGMPLQSLEGGVPWDWSSTAEYLDRLEDTLAINAGFMVGHSAMRRLVMEEAANERACTDEELAAMARLLRAGLAAGGLGFSTTNSESHSDADGCPVPSRFADRREMVELARICGEFEGTSLELLPFGATQPKPFDPDVGDLMIEMSAAAARPLNWNVIQPTAASLDGWLEKLGVSDQARSRGAKVIGLTMPVDMMARFSFHAGFVLDMFDGWAPFLARPVPERLAVLADPEQRTRLRERAERTSNMKHLSAWERLVLVETFAPENAAYGGRYIGEIARELRKDPWEALIDIVITDGLRTTFARGFRPPTDADWQARLRLWRDPRAMIGASDSGAHLDMIAAFRYSTGLLQEAVRERGLLSMEEAIHRLTDQPARLYGIRDRGVVREGAWADVLILDPQTIGSGSVHTRFDLPGGAGRLYADAAGIDHVLVAGMEIVRDGKMTEARPGRLLRSGRDTATPSMAT